MKLTTKLDQTSELIEVRVASRTQESREIASFRLESLDGSRLIGFEAGAHIDVRTGTDQFRQYSLCNPAPVVDHYEIAVLKDPNSRGGSVFMHECLEVGATVLVSRPKNHFKLVDTGPVLLFAGGIGITPIWAMAQQMAKKSRAFEMHYCARSREAMAFLQRLEQSSFHESVHFHFDDESAKQKLNMAEVLARTTDQHHLYVCGPAGFIKYVMDAALQAGWPDRRMHREFFSAPTTINESAVDGAFEIQLARSGRCINVLPEQSALVALQAAGVEVDASCEAGVCGTCVTKVLGGIPDHRDVFLTDEEHGRNDCFTPCCSRALTPQLILDL